jgi:hypothetical protein
MTCGVHGIYLKFGSFNGIDPIVPKKIIWTLSISRLGLIPIIKICIFTPRLILMDNNNADQANINYQNVYTTPSLHHV